MYTQAKFQELSEQRKLRVILDFIYKIEQNWENDKFKFDSIDQLTSYFKWFGFFESKNRYLKKLADLEFSLRPEMTLRQLLNLAVPIERYLNVSIKDEHMLVVTREDQTGNGRQVFPIRLVLDHLRSAFNVGSIYRTAECLGIEHIYLIGYSPTPSEAGVVKTAMGCEKLVSWSQHDHISEVVQILNQDGFMKVGLETIEGGKNFDQLAKGIPVALFVGNERFGLSEDLICQLDACVSIPMRGQKNSLNVSNAISIASYVLSNNWLGQNGSHL